MVDEYWSHKNELIREEILTRFNADNGCTWIMQIIRNILTAKLTDNPFVLGVTTDMKKAIDDYITRMVFIQFGNIETQEDMINDFIYYMTNKMKGKKMYKDTYDPKRQNGNVLSELAWDLVCMFEHIRLEAFDKSELDSSNDEFSYPREYLDNPHIFTMVIAQIGSVIAYTIEYAKYIRNPAFNTNPRVIAFGEKFAMPWMMPIICTVFECFRIGDMTPLCIHTDNTTVLATTMEEAINLFIKREVEKHFSGEGMADAIADFIIDFHTKLIPFDSSLRVYNGPIPQRNILSGLAYYYDVVSKNFAQQEYQEYLANQEQIQVYSPNIPEMIFDEPFNRRNLVDYMFDDHILEFLLGQFIVRIAGRMQYMKLKITKKMYHVIQASLGDIRQIIQDIINTYTSNDGDDDDDDYDDDDDDDDDDDAMEEED